MRIHLFAAPLFLIAAPVAAQPTEPMQIPPQLTDPAMAETLGDMMQVLSKSLLDMRVGEIQAAAEGRQATAEEKRLTVRDLGRRKDPNFDRNFERQIAQSKPMIQNSMRALAQALPAMSSTLSEAAGQMERVIENMPRPDYPRR